MSSGKPHQTARDERVEAGRTNNTSGLLQNMCTVPRAQIQHRSPYRRARCRGIVFALRNGQDPLTGLLAAPGPGGPGLACPEDAGRELRQRIDAHARTLDLPPAALATDRVEPGDEHCDDLLSIVTVLSKSSGQVYLRDKVPNLNQIKPGRRVVLIVPDERK
jgi:hypothetical protein